MNSDEPSRRAIGISAALVVMLAIFLRLPSSHESFWVDELHTAWAVSDSLSEAVDRAAQGHQTPVYFMAVWFWKQLVGEGELALRLSSILAVAAAGGVLVVALARTAGTLVAGVLGGLILAIESNSLFFGTELRPYAWVILLASLAVACFARLWPAESRHGDRSAWAALVILCVLAAVMQPTAAGVLAWLPLVLLVRWWWRSSSGAVRRWSRTDSVLAAVVVAASWVIWQTTLRQTWGQRQIWAAFAAADHFRQVLRVWPWTSLVGVPLALVAAGRIVARSARRRDQARLLAGPAVVLFVSAIGVTMLYWLVARAEWLPVWHRRYFIAVLPLMAAGAGLSAGSLSGALPASAAGRSGAWAAAGCVIIALAWQQGTAVGLWRLPGPLVRRGEDWRGAAAWIRSVRHRDDPVYVDAGLIESTLYLSPSAEAEPRLTAAQREYLSYPLRGPYRVQDPQHVEPIARNLPRETWTRTDSAGTRRDAAEPGGDNPGKPEGTAKNAFVISRRPVAHLKSVLASAGAASSSSGSRPAVARAEYRGFGGVSVARVPLAPSR